MSNGSMTSLRGMSTRPGSERSIMVPEDFLLKTDTVVHTMGITTSTGNAETTMCTVFFPYLFEQLRDHLEPDGNCKFVESLMNSHSVELTGGQVGSFLKTADDRFIIKVIKKVEAESFGRHAKEYVDYIYQRCTQEGEGATALVKILGFFRIRHNHYHRSQYIIVMENLFPAQRAYAIDRQFDLKGCTYGRRQKEEGATGFERNLMEYTGGSPLLMTPAAKARFNEAVRADTEFLAALKVVDYSLLIGVDTTRKTLVVGIVDYCREFNFGLRMYGSMTGGRTIIAPKDYRERFCYQMDRFLMHVPSFCDELEPMEDPNVAIGEAFHAIDEEED